MTRREVLTKRASKKTDERELVSVALPRIQNNREPWPNDLNTQEPWTVSCKHGVCEVIWKPRREAA
jgi:hypothetical protein